MELETHFVAADLRQSASKYRFGNQDSKILRDMNLVFEHVLRDFEWYWIDIGEYHAEKGLWKPEPTLGKTH